MFTDRNIKFTDARKVVSLRDGYQEYYGAEIGMSPEDKIFRIYRDEKEVRKVAGLMHGLAMTDNHIDMNGEVPHDLKVGEVLTANVVSAFHDFEGTVEVENKVLLNREMSKVVNEGKRELSLGYFAKLEAFGDHFKQVDFEPHHLAIVEAGRCEKSCKFKDDTIMTTKITKGNQMKRLIEGFKALSSIEQKRFADAVGIKSRTKFVDKIKTVPAKVTAQMRKQFGDQAVEKFLDSKQFSDAMKKENEAYARKRVAIVDKAKNFLDSDYKFDERSNDAIMADAVKAEYGDTAFADSEVGTAFKTLKAGTKIEAKMELKDTKAEIDALAELDYK